MANHPLLLTRLRAYRDWLTGGRTGLGEGGRFWWEGYAEEARDELDKRFPELLEPEADAQVDGTTSEANQ